MKIEVERKVSPEEYRNILSEIRFNYLFFQSPKWVSILLDSLPGAELSLIIARDDSGGTKAVIPGVEYRRGLFSGRMSMPFGTYGGILGEVDRKTGREMIRKFFDERIHGGLRGDFACVFPPELPRIREADALLQDFVPERVEISKGITRILPVEDDVEVMWKKMTSNNRREVRLARKAGIVVSEGKSSRDLEILFELQQACLPRWGRSRMYSRDMIMRLGGPDTLLLIARFQDKPVGALLGFRENLGRFDWMLPNLAEYRKARPVYALVWRSIELAVEQGLMYVNMGAAGGNPGVDLFKKKFGAGSYSYTILSRAGGLFNLGRKTVSMKRAYSSGKLYHKR